MRTWRLHSHLQVFVQACTHDGFQPRSLAYLSHYLGLGGQGDIKSKREYQKGRSHLLEPQRQQLARSARHACHMALHRTCNTKLGRCCTASSAAASSAGRMFCATFVGGGNEGMWVSVDRSREHAGGVMVTRSLHPLCCQVCCPSMPATNLDFILQAHASPQVHHEHHGEGHGPSRQQLLRHGLEQVYSQAGGMGAAVSQPSLHLPLALLHFGGRPSPSGARLHLGRRPDPAGRVKVKQEAEIQAARKLTSC